MKIHYSGLAPFIEDLADFRQSEPGSPLGCREQHQQCVTTSEGLQCTELLGDPDVDFALWDIVKADKTDNSWFSFLHWTTFSLWQGTLQPLEKLGINVLRARDKFDKPFIGMLPDNQWQIEMQHWFNTAMAYQQSLFLSLVLGTTDPDLQSLYSYRPNSTWEWEVCSNQVRMRSFVIVLQNEGYRETDNTCGTPENHLRCTYFLQHIGIELRHSGGQLDHHPLLHAEPAYLMLLCSLLS